MKRKQGFSTIGLFLVMGILVFGNCAPMIAADKTSDLPKDISGVLDKAMEQAMQGQGLTVEGWPQGKVPAEILPYQRGKVVNSGGTAEEYTILVETNRAELQEYLGELAALGWYVEDDGDYPTSRLLNIDLRFQFNSKTMLQISVYVKDLGLWPHDTLPADIFPPEKGTLIGEVQIQDLDAHGHQYMISYEYDGLTEEDVAEYMEELIGQGWKGDEYMVSKDIAWNGSTFDASIEPYYDEGTVIFDCYLFKQD